MTLPKSLEKCVYNIEYSYVSEISNHLLPFLSDPWFLLAAPFASLECLIICSMSCELLILLFYHTTFSIIYEYIAILRTAIFGVKNVFLLLEVPTYFLAAC